MHSEFLPLNEHKQIKRAIYAGSFDPITNGHVWVIETALSLFDEVIVAIGENPDKKYTFSLTERLDMLNKCAETIEKNYQRQALLQSPGDFSDLHNFCFSKLKVDFFENKFLIDYAVEKKATFIIRGVRNAQDFEFEKTLQNVNVEINPTPHPITTILLSPPKQLSEVSSSIVKSLCGPNNWENIVGRMVPSLVLSKLKEWKNGVAS